MGQGGGGSRSGSAGELGGSGEATTASSVSWDHACPSDTPGHRHTHIYYNLSDKDVLHMYK